MRNPIKAQAKDFLESRCRVLAAIKENDLTEYILSDTYAVNEENIYEEWTDANHTVHRDIKRKRISGSFSLWHQTKEKYEAFINLINAFAVKGILPITVHVANTLETREINAFYSFSVSIKEENNAGYVYSTVEIVLEEQ